MSSDTWTAERKYEEPRAHAVRERYLGLFGGPELPVPVEAIAGDLLGLRIEESASGLSQSEAIRYALIQAAYRRRDELLAEEARRVAADPEDRAEMAAVAALMDSLRPE